MRVCVGFFVCLSASMCCTLFCVFMFACIWGAALPTWEAKCWHFSLQTHKWILSKSHYTGQNEDAGSENAVAYGYFISPMFLITLQAASYFPLTHVLKRGLPEEKNCTGTKPCKLIWSWCRHFSLQHMPCTHSYSLIPIYCWQGWHIHPNCWGDRLT